MTKIAKDATCVCEVDSDSDTHNWNGKPYLQHCSCLAMMSHYFTYHGEIFTYGMACLIEKEGTLKLTMKNKKILKKLFKLLFF